MLLINEGLSTLSLELVGHLTFAHSGVFKHLSVFMGVLCKTREKKKQQQRDEADIRFVAFR